MSVDGNAPKQMAGKPPVEVAKGSPHQSFGYKEGGS